MPIFKPMPMPMPTSIPMPIYVHVSVKTVLGTDGARCTRTYVSTLNEMAISKWQAVTRIFYFFPNA